MLPHLQVSKNNYLISKPETHLSIVVYKLGTVIFGVTSCFKQGGLKIIYIGDSFSMEEVKGVD